MARCFTYVVESLHHYFCHSTKTSSSRWMMPLRFWGAGEASSHQQDPQDAGKKARSVHKQPEGKEPKTPKYFGDTKIRDYAN